MPAVPLRRRPRVEIEKAPEPDARHVTVTVDDDGLTQIDYGSSQPADEQREPDTDPDSFDRNLAEDLDPQALAALASYLIEGIDADDQARADWQDTANRGADYLGIKLTDPASSVAADGTVCQVVSTVMLEAAMKLWATGVAELLPTDGPVKVKREATAVPPPAAGIGHNGGPPMTGQGIAGAAQPGQPPVTGDDAAGDNLAEALETDMNWYLTDGDEGYYPDVRQMLMSRNVIGMAFREVFDCPIEEKPLSRWVMAQDLIVQGNPAHLSTTTGRVTKRAKVAQSTMRRLQAMGYYLDVPLVQPTGITSPTEIVIGESEGVQPTPLLPRDFEHTVYECSTDLGDVHNIFGMLATLDNDETGHAPGYPLPYRVSMDVDSRTVLAVRRNWERGDKRHKRCPRFVKYGFLPSFGFYDWGLIHVVGNPTQAATMIQRSIVDASLYSNFPSWMRGQGPGSRVETTVFRPNPGEVITVPLTSGAKLADSLMPWPYKEPSAQSMAMGAKLEGDVRKLAGQIDLPVGEGRIGNTPVGTIMSYIETVSMVPGAVHKADHTSQRQEFQMLRRLLAKRPELLWRGNPTPAREWQVAQEILDPNLVPAADPNTPSQIHRLMKIQGLVSLGGQQQFALGDADGPIVNQRAIFRRAAEVLAGSDADEFTLPPRPPQAAPPPPPDPRIVAAQIKAQSEQAKGQMQQQEDGAKHQERMQEIAVESQEREADRQSAETRAALSLAAARAKTGADAAEGAADRGHEAAQNTADRAHEAGIAAMGHVAAAHQQQQQQASSAPLSATEDDNGST
jgi:hypothetical protein